MTRPVWLLVAALAALASMAMLARVERRMLLAAGTRMSLRRMVELRLASNALNWTLPGGTAVAAGFVTSQLRRWGASTAAAGFTVAASGVLSAVAFAGLAVAGSAVGGPGASGAVVVGALATAAVGGLVILRRRPGAVPALAERMGRLAGTLVRLVRRDPAPVREAVRRFVGELVAIHPRRRDWALGLGFAAGNWLADLLCLYACVQALGIDVHDTGLLVITYIVGMSASSISLLPGGLGVVDGAMLAALSGAGSVAAGPALSIVVTYRLISCALVVVAGWGCWYALRRANRRLVPLPVAARAVEVTAG